jgi:hypothetical protein
MLSRLLCKVGLHRPVLPGEWNLGYCFSRCRYCESNMVRSVLGGWKNPKSFRVIRTGQFAAYDDLDNFLRSREQPRRKAAEKGLGHAPQRDRAAFPISALPGRVGSRTGSPFDFSDFEAGPSSPKQSLKNAKIG